MNRFLRLAATTALTALLAIGGATAASAQGGASMTANPSTIAVNDTTTITATGLGGLEQASFGFGGTPGGVLSADGGSTGGTSITRPVSNGQTTVVFRPTQTGTFTIAVGTGESALATVQVTVTSAAQPTSAPATPIIEVGTPLVVGQPVRVEAKNVGNLDRVGFGLDSPDAGSFSGGGSTGPSITADVTDGTSTVDFTPARSGSVTIALSDGETVLASAVVQVSAAPATPTASPTPSATPSATATPAPAAVVQSAPILPWILLGLALLALIGLVVWMIVSRRRAARANASGTAGE